MNTKSDISDPLLQIDQWRLGKKVVELLSALSHDSADVKIAALKALRELEVKDISPIAALLTAPAGQVCVETVATLVKLGAAEPLRTLAATTKTQEPWVHNETIQAVSTLKPAVDEDWWKIDARQDIIHQGAAARDIKKTPARPKRKSRKMQASDIHLEPFEKELRVRFRVDSVLHNILSLPVNVRHGVTSRIKVMSNLDISEKRRPRSCDSSTRESSHTSSFPP